MKTKAVINNADGTQGIATLTWPSNHGALACQLVMGIISGEIITRALQEDERAVNCKRIAVIACDLAEAMYAEMEVRDWLLQLADPGESK